MIQLNKIYSTQELADELGIAYKTLKNSRQEYEKHLSRFYFYKIDRSGRATYYTFTEQKFDYIPYKEYKKNSKKDSLRHCVTLVIRQDNRQTGSNIARVIHGADFAPPEIKELKLSTLKIYVREELKELVLSQKFKKEDYQWCYLDKTKNQYILMTQQEIEELRFFFNPKYALEIEEKLLVMFQEKEISEQEFRKELGDLRASLYIEGLKKYYSATGKWAMKIPVYIERAW